MNDFIRIRLPGGSMAYGGDQAWFREKLGTVSGCGSVAAANMLASLAKKDPALRKKWCLDFTGDDIISQESFLDFQESVFSCIGSWRFPKPMGIGIWRYTKKTLLFAAKHQVFLRPHVLVTTCIMDYHRPLAFIENGLKHSGAITLLTSWNSFSNIKNHFITITDMEKASDGRIKLTASTWGKKAVYSYDEIWKSWQDFRSVDTALIYFTPVRNPSVTTRGIRRSYRLLIFSIFRAISYFFQSLGTK